MKMTPQEISIISDWNKKIIKPVRLTLKISDSGQGREMKSFCDNLSSILSKVEIYQEKADENDMPAIMVNDQLIYHAVPLGPELQPFLEALLQRNRLTGSITAKLKSITSPTVIRLFIAPNCPRCPAVVSQIVPLSEANHRIKVTIIDGTMFHEIAEKENVRSAPTVIFENFRWTGEVKIHEIVDIITDRNPSNLGSETLKGIIHEGEASRVARMMLDNKKIVPAFIDLLVHEKWPVRLGAMVVVEEIIENDPRLASELIDPVQERFNSLDDQVKGDMIYIFGEAGTPEIIAKLKMMLEGSPTDEIRTVVLEAVECIKIRHGLS